MRERVAVYGGELTAAAPQAGRLARQRAAADRSGGMNRPRRLSPLAVDSIVALVLGIFGATEVIRATTPARRGRRRRAC